MQRARLKRFYALSEIELDNLQSSDWQGYLEAIRVLNAQEKLEQIKVAAFTDLKPQARRKILKAYQKDASRTMPKRALSLKEAMEALNGR